MDLQSLINSQPPNAVLELPPGEFFGRIVIDKPITIVGSGKSTWVGSQSPPAVRITVRGVELRNLMVEVVSQPGSVAIEALPGTDPILQDVVVRGAVTGVPPGNMHGTKREDIKDSVRISFDPPSTFSAGTDLSSAASDPSNWVRSARRRTSREPEGKTSSTSTMSSAAGSLPWMKLIAAGAAVIIVALVAIAYVANDGTGELAQSLKEKERLKTLEKDRIERERLESERQEKKRALAKLREMEKERLEAERLQRERLERERQEKAQALAKLKEMERLKIEAEQREREQLERRQKEELQASARPAITRLLPLPRPPPVRVRTLPKIEEGNWVVVLGSFPKVLSEEARERANLVKQAGFDAQVVDTDGYPKLTAGLWAIVLGPYSKEHALDMRNKTRAIVRDAYVKEWK